MPRSLASCRILLLIFAISVLGLAFALFSQHVLGMRPCAWCVLQRLILCLTAAFSGLGSLALAYKRSGLAKLSALLGLISSLGGILSAWYQYSVAAHMFSCDQTLADRFMTQSGLESSLPWLFGIYATCMDARVNLFGIEYALWALTLFVILSLGFLIVLLRRPTR